MVITKEAVKSNVNPIIECILSETREIFLLSKTDEYSIRLLCEEILVNIVQYAYEERPGNKSSVKKNVSVEIGYDQKNRTLKLCFIDQGVPFNPLIKDNPVLETDLSDRPVGGLGIYLVRQMADTLSYEWTGSENRLTVIRCMEEKNV